MFKSSLTRYVKFDTTKNLHVYRVTICDSEFSATVEAEAEYDYENKHVAAVSAILKTYRDNNLKYNFLLFMLYLQETYYVSIPRQLTWYKNIPEFSVLRNVNWSSLNNIR